MTTYAVSIVLITCNRAKSLEVCLDSLLTQRVRKNARFELIVVDDGSTDETEAVVRRLARRYPERELLYLRTAGLGIPAARNFGSAKAQHEWLGCFDDDQIAQPGWLDGLIEAIEVYKADCVSGALELLLPANVAIPLGPRVRAILGEHKMADMACSYSGEHVPNTGNVILRRDLFVQVGGFDTNFKQGGSDADFFLRLRDRSVSMWYTPNAIALHVIPEWRATRKHIRWICYKVGAARARVDRKRSRTSTVLLSAALRMAVLAFRDIPLVILMRFFRNEQQRLDSYCRIWFASSYLRAVFALLFPSVGTAFLSSLDFRRHGGERADV